MVQDYGTVTPFTEEHRDRVALVSGRVHPELAHAVAEFLGTELDPVQLKDFPNGEIGVMYEKSVRGRDVYVMQTHYQTPGFDIHRGIFEQSLMIDAAKRAGARSVIAVVPHAAYARQDRKADGRVPLSAAMMFGRQLGAADAIVAIDLHSQQAQGFVNGEKPFVTLTAFNVLTEAVEASIQQDRADWVVVATDAGGAKLAEDWAEELELDFIGLSKVRKRGDSSQFLDAELSVPDLTGRKVIIVDDMIDTGGTIARATQKMRSAGAGKVFLVATHPLFSGQALEAMQASKAEKIFVTNTVPTQAAEAVLGDVLEVVKIHSVIGSGISRMVNGRSISGLFGNKNHR